MQQQMATCIDFLDWHQQFSQLIQAVSIKIRLRDSQVDSIEKRLASRVTRCVDSLQVNVAEKSRKILPEKRTTGTDSITRANQPLPNKTLEQRRVAALQRRAECLAQGEEHTSSHEANCPCLASHSKKCSGYLKEVHSTHTNKYRVKGNELRLSGEVFFTCKPCKDELTLCLHGSSLGECTECKQNMTKCPHDKNRSLCEICSTNSTPSCSNDEVRNIKRRPSMPPSQIIYAESPGCLELCKASGTLKADRVVLQLRAIAQGVSESMVASLPDAQGGTLPEPQSRAMQSVVTQNLTSLTSSTGNLDLLLENERKQNELFRLREEHQHLQQKQQHRATLGAHQLGYAPQPGSP